MIIKIKILQSDIFMDLAGDVKASSTSSVKIMASGSSATHTKCYQLGPVFWKLYSLATRCISSCVRWLGRGFPNIEGLTQSGPVRILGRKWF